MRLCSYACKSEQTCRIADIYLAQGMVDIKTFTELALGFEEAVEQPHFHKSSFRIRKKIFATLDITANTAVIKLSDHEQVTFLDIGKGAIAPVKGAWGKQGWTEIDLKTVPKDVLIYALKTSYCRVAPKTLAKHYT